MRWLLLLLVSTPALATSFDWPSPFEFGRAFISSRPAPGILARYSLATMDGVTFTRASPSTCILPDGTVQRLAANEPCLSGGLRMRPEVKNLLKHSENFGDDAWLKSASVSTETGVAAGPDGAQTASRLWRTIGAEGSLYQGIVSTGGVYTCSVWARAGTGSYLGLLLFNSTTQVSNGAFTWPSIGAGWQRYTITTTSPVPAGQTIRCQLYSAPAGVQGGDIYIWGAQLVEGTLPLDYCPSGATPSTCAAELATIPRPAGLSETEGCVALTVRPTWTGINPMSKSAHFLTSGGNTSFAYQTSNTGSISAQVLSTYYLTVGAGFVAGQPVRIVTSWDVAGTGLTLRNATTGESVSRPIPSFPIGSLIYVGSHAADQQPLGAAISDIVFGRTAGACR